MVQSRTSKLITRQKQVIEAEQIELLRGSSVVSTFVGAFGSSLRETRLTALLGYLVALEPETFFELFGFDGQPVSVRLENCHEDGRSDILVETSLGIGVIEAKIDRTNPFQQSQKYKTRWAVLLTQHIPSGKGRWKHTRYLSWQELVDFLGNVSCRSHNPKTRFISQDLCDYLEEHHMAKQRESVEVYAREINEPVTLTLFLKSQLYGCWYERGSRLPEASYFAPHFGQNISYEHPGTKVGISYIARIEQLVTIETWQELLDAIITARGKHWLNAHMSVIQPLKLKWDWKTQKRRNFLFLAAPRLVFNPPVLKENLQKGRGWLSKRFLSFDELFAAWGC